MRKPPATGVVVICLMGSEAAAKLAADGWTLADDSHAPGTLEYERQDITTADQAEDRLAELGLSDGVARVSEWVGC